MAGLVLSCPVLSCLPCLASASYTRRACAALGARQTELALRDRIAPERQESLFCSCGRRLRVNKPSPFAAAFSTTRRRQPRHRRKDQTTNNYPTTNNKQQTNQNRQNALRTPSIVLIIINLLPPPPPPPEQQPPHPNPPAPTPSLLDNNNTINKINTINTINTMSSLPPHRHRPRHNQPATRPRRLPEPFCRGLDERPGVGCAAGWVSWFA